MIRGLKYYLYRGTEIAHARCGCAVRHHVVESKGEFGVSEQS